MDEVILKVNLQDQGNTLNTLTQMQAKIDELNGKTVNIKVNSASISAVQNSFSNMRNSVQAAASAVSGLGEPLKSVDTKLTKGVSGMETYIRSLNGMSDATVKATGLVSTGGQVFQTYAATVKNTDGSFQNYTYSVNTATGATYQMEKGVTSVDTAAAHMGDTFGNLITKVAKWAAITTLVYAPIRAFKDAVTELKNVDTEMVTIQKVTNATAEDMERLGAAAYTVAENYGTTASQYLSSVSEFAKAGYTELSDSLGQLAMKTKVVGDTDQATANQFLLSVDAAYKYKGSVEELSKVLDGANQIGNEYATDVQKIAEGLGTVSSIAANAHVGINELTAAIGTITAVTQRSGSEAARALRALILNITGNTKIALDEDSEETWTAEEIEAMTGALTRFNIATRETVDGIVKLRDPMEVIGDMAKQWKEGFINEADMNDLVQNLGGKLRSNQLMALIDNWDMYEKQLKTYENSLGSADQEFGIYLNSWEAKLNQLSAAWTKFVSEYNIEDIIKGTLDLATALLNLADNGFVQTTVQAAALTVGIVLLVKAFGALKGAAAGTALIQCLIGIANGSEAASAALAILTGQMLASPLFWAVAGGLLIFTAYKLIDKFSDSIKNCNKSIEETSAQISDVESKLAQLKADGAGSSIIDAYQKKLDKLNDDLKDLNQHKLDLEFSEQVNTGADVIGPYGEVVQETKNKVQDLIDQHKKLKDQMESAPDTASFEKLEDQFGNVDDALTDYYIDMLTARENGLQFSDSQWTLYQQLVELYGGVEDVSKAHLEMAASQATNAHDAADLSQALLQEAAQAGLTKKEIYNLTAQSIIFNNTGMDVTQKLAALRSLAAQAGYTAATIAAVMSTDALANWVDMEMNSGSTQDEAITSYFKHVSSRYFSEIQADAAAVVPGSNDPNPSGSSKSSSKSSKSTKDPQLESLKNIVSLRKSELSLMQERGDSTEKQIAKMREIQSALHSEAEYMRSIGSDQSDINALSTEHWQITNSINDLLKKQAEEQEKNAKALQDELDSAIEKRLNAAKKVRDEELSAIDAQINAIKTRNQKEDDALNLEEKRLAVEKAWQALRNAQSERTVRQIRADGSWEWIANQSAVEKAQEALSDAQSTYDELQKELAYQATLDALEAEKERINVQYDAFEDQWDAIKNSLETPSRDISDILNDIAKNGTPAMQSAVNSVTSMLDGLASYIGNVTQKTQQITNASGGSGSGHSGEITVDDILNGVGGLGFKDGYDPYGGGDGDGGTSNSAGSSSGSSHTSGGDGFGGYGDPDDYITDWGSSGAPSSADGKKSYDSGGIATGKGYMPKATDRKETVLPPDITAKLLNPESNAQFHQFVEDQRLLFGAVEHGTDGGNFTASKISSTDRHDQNYFINGIKLGSDQANKPLSQILSSLPLHTERS